MEWLAKNLSLAYPFDDQVTDPITRVVADALISCGVEGPLTLATFTPGELTNAVVVIKKGTTIVLSTSGATVTTLGSYTILEGSDTERGTRYRFIVDGAAALSYPFLVSPVEFSPAACAFNGDVVSSLNGLDGDVILSIPQHSGIAEEDNVVTIGFNDPEDRVDCSAADCDQVFTLNGQLPDQFGSFNLIPDDCYRLVPSPDGGNTLLLFNLCSSCLDCDNVLQLDSKLVEQAGYYHHLAAIYHDHFNRFQRGVGTANLEISAARVRGSADSDGSGAVVDQGIVDMSGRSFNRPYFSQLSLAIVNSTPYHVSVALAITVTGVDGQVAFIDDSSVLQRFQTTGTQFTKLTGIPGSESIDLDPQEQVAVSTEVQRVAFPEDGSSSVLGAWHVTAAITFTSGPGTLPSPNSIIRTYPLELKPGI